jgi:DNA-binding GntR family transcriptional regulator
MGRAARLQRVHLSPVVCQNKFASQQNPLAFQRISDKLYGMKNTIYNDRPTSLTKWVREQLKEQILDCSLAPGARIVEKDLCAKMGVSRTPLREALQQLTQEGLISLIQHRGYQVMPITLQDIRDLWEIRRVVESESAYLAATRRTPEEITELRRLAGLPYVPGDRKTYKMYLQNNTAFHVALARCTHNLRLVSAVRSVLEQLQRPIYLGLDIGIDSTRATDEHLDLVKAIEARNPALARQVMVEQIANTQDRILQATAVNPTQETTETPEPIRQTIDTGNVLLRSGSAPAVKL